MTGRTVAAVSSLALALAAVGCLNVYEVTIETPIQSKIDVSRFQRVLVAGFVTGGSRAVDTNTETVRLLKSQLHKSDLKVVDTDPVSLDNEVDKLRSQAGQPPLVPAPLNPADPKVKDAKDVKAYSEIFSEADYWKRIGEPYQGTLIVTGSILLSETNFSGQQSVVKPTQDATGRTTYTEDRQTVDRKGFSIDPTFVFIDAQTGAQLYSETYHQEVSYATSQNTPALSSYFELMDKVLPGFLSTLSTQKIKGTRILLK